MKFELVLSALVIVSAFSILLAIELFKLSGINSSLQVRFSREIEHSNELHDAIVKHRNAKGHDRCWLNDLELYKVLGDEVVADLKLPPLVEFIPECIKYHQRCNHDCKSNPS